MEIENRDPGGGQGSMESRKLVSRRREGIKCYIDDKIKAGERPEKQGSCVTLAKKFQGYDIYHSISSNTT